MPLKDGFSSELSLSTMETNQQSTECNLSSCSHSDGPLRFKTNPESIPKNSDLYVIFTRCPGHIISYPDEEFTEDFDNHGNYTDDFYEKKCSKDKTKIEPCRAYNISLRMKADEPTEENSPKIASKYSRKIKAKDEIVTTGLAAPSCKKKIQN